MNKVILMGRLTRNPDIRYSQGDNSMCVARFTLAVDRRFKRDNEATADFISCVAFGKTGEFIEKYTHQGTKICLEGRIQTGSYVKQDGTKVYTTDVVVENAEFAESKAASGQPSMGTVMQQNYQGQQQYQQAPPMQQPAGNENGSYGQSGQGYGQQQDTAGARQFRGDTQSDYDSSRPGPMQEAAEEGFMQIPDGMTDEGLPFN